VPPPNEQCQGAIVFSDDDLPFETTGALGCVNDIIDRPYFDVFYRFDCSRSGSYLLDMCGSVGDTYVRVYTGGCGWLDGEEFAVGDDECPGSPPDADPLVVLELVAGESYWIEIGAWRPDPPFAPPTNAPYVLRLTFEDPVAPVPALPTWGAIGLSALLLVMGSMLMRKRGYGISGPPLAIGDQGTDQN